MTLQEAIRIRVLELCEENNLTINGLAVKSKLPQSTVNSLIDGTSKNPTTLTILNICLGINIKLKDFYDSEVFDDIK